MDKNKKLVDLGFVLVTEDDVNGDSWNKWHEDYWAQDNYVMDIGGGRRGQSYYFVIPPDCSKLSIYATKPDGEGAEASLDFELIAKIRDILGVKHGNI